MIAQDQAVRQIALAAAARKLAQIYRERLAGAREHDGDGPAEAPVTSSQLHRLLNIVRTEGTEELAQFAERVRKKDSTRHKEFWKLIRELCDGELQETADLRRTRDDKPGWESSDLEQLLGFLVIEILYHQQHGRRVDHAGTPQRPQRRRHHRR